MSFPTSPTSGQTATVNGITYTYNTTSTAWIRVPTAIITATSLTLTSTATSTGTTTGALIVAGGMGVGGTLYAGSFSAGGIRTTTTSTAPANPTVGDLWYYTTGDTIFRYTNDGVNLVWVDITGPTTSLNTATSSGGGGSSGPYTLNYLLVGGGGGGSSGGGGAGSGGGVFTGTLLVSSPGTAYNITVGGGGGLGTSGSPTTATFTTPAALAAGGIYNSTGCYGGGGAGGASPGVSHGANGASTWTNIVQVAGVGQNITGTFYIAGGGSAGYGGYGGYGGGGQGKVSGNSAIFGPNAWPYTGGGGGGGYRCAPVCFPGGVGSGGFGIVWYQAPAVQGSGGKITAIYPGVSTATVWVHAFTATGTYTA